VVRPKHRQPRLVLAPGPRHHSRAGRHPARQSTGEPRAAGLAGAGVGRGPIRPEAHLSADPELDDVSALVDRENGPAGGGGPLRALPGCADEALQMHGGYGYIDEYKVQRIYRDAKIVEIYEGTKEIEKTIVAKRLLAI